MKPQDWQEIAFRYMVRLQKQAKRGMRAALADCPRCHFGMLQGLYMCIRNQGRDGAICASEISRAMHQAPPAISRGLRVMEQDGLIERTADPTDRRKTLVRLTPWGESCRKQCEQALWGYFEATINRIDPQDLAEMHRLHEILLQAIESENAARQAAIKEDTPDEEDF